MKILFSTQSGSQLYGTFTSTSDVDLKHVVLPSLNNMLLGKRLTNEVIKTNNKKFERNSAEDVDIENIPVQILAYDFLGGQTYALELAFAVDYTEAGQIIHDPLILGFCRELRCRFLTSNMSALIGYAVNQASLYSFKGERLNAVRAVKDLFLNIGLIHGPTAKPNEYSVEFENMAKEIEKQFPKSFSITEYEVDCNGTMKPCIKVLEKILPYTSTFETSLKVVNAQLKKYGSRADAASIDNVDWKATSHALRVVEEGITLLKDRNLIFPFNKEYVDLLVSIKLGKLPYNEVIDMINVRLDELKALEVVSTLPKSSPELAESLNTWLAEWLRQWYGLPYTI
jgi:hypothetical protein